MKTLRVLFEDGRVFMYRVVSKAPLQSAQLMDEVAEDDFTPYRGAPLATLFEDPEEQGERT